MTQLKYGEQAIGIHGGIADEQNRSVRSYSAKGDIANGLAAARVAGADGEHEVEIGAGLVDGFRGISIRDVGREQEGYLDKETVATMDAGSVWLVCPTGTAPNGLAKYNTTTGVIDAGVAGAGENQMDGAFWDTNTAPGELGRLIIKTTDITAGV